MVPLRIVDDRAHGDNKKGPMVLWFSGHSGIHCFRHRFIGCAEINRLAAVQGLCIAQPHCCGLYFLSFASATACSPAFAVLAQSPRLAIALEVTLVGPTACW